MKNITKNIFNSLKESSSGNTIKEYAMNYLGGFIDNDVTDTEIDMMVAFSFDFNEEPDADFKEYSRFMNLIAERTKIVKVNDSEYGATLVCDFSSVLKPYNEEWKDFFDMDNSEFNEEDAWAEAVDNLEPLISGNAGDSTYKDFCDILEGKNKDGNVVTNEADNMESIIDEAARYLFDEGDSDYLPDYEEFNDSIMEIPKDLFDKAKDRALEALGNLAEHSYYDHENHGQTYLELNSNHTLWELEDDGMPFDEEGYTIMVQQAADDFEEQTGTKMYFLGRSARHVCVEPTYDNCMNFTYLQELQEKLEKGVIEAYNADSKQWKEEQEKEDMNESVQTKYDSVMIDAEEFEPIPICYNLNKPMTDKELISYINKNDYALDKIGTEVSEEELKGKTYKCNLMMNESNVDDALNRMKQASEEVANIDKNTGIRKKQLINNIEDIVYTYDNGISDGYEEPFKTEEEMINYVYNDVFDQKSDGNGSTRYGKGICKDLKYLGKDYIVSEIIRIGNEVGIVEKPINEQEAVNEFNAEEMNESIYTTDDGTPANIVADNIMHADSDPRFQTKEQVKDKKLCVDLADFALETTDEEYWNEYSDEDYYEKNKRDYMRQINDVSFVKGVVDLLETRLRNLGGVDEEYDTESLLAEFKEKLSSLEKPINEEIENKELYIYSNAESEDKSDAISWAETYKNDAPNLKFKIHSEGPMYFVDFIGSKEDIASYLKDLGWYTDEDIESMELIKPYNKMTEDVDYSSDIDEENTEDVSNAEPIGIYTVSNNSAILVYQIEYDIEDKVLVGDSSDTTKAHWTDIIYEPNENDEVDSYFYYGDIKVPFNEVMRTDI